MDSEIKIICGKIIQAVVQHGAFCICQGSALMINDSNKSTADLRIWGVQKNFYASYSFTYAEIKGLSDNQISEIAARAIRALTADHTMN